MGNKHAGCRINEKFKSQVQYEEFQGHSTAIKCIYMPLNHELEVSNPFNIQTECYALT